MSQGGNREIEARFININQREIEDKLGKLGAKRIGLFNLEEWIFQPDGWEEKGRKRVRVRTDGDKTWVTYKESLSLSVDGTREIEFLASSCKDAVDFLLASEFPLIRRQQKKRTRYELGDIVFEIDNWPKIPDVLEIESDSEEGVKKGAELLGLDWDKAILEDQRTIHKKYFGVDMDDYKEYLFD